MSVDGGRTGFVPRNAAQLGMVYTPSSPDWAVPRQLDVVLGRYLHGAGGARRRARFTDSPLAIFPAATSPSPALPSLASLESPAMRWPGASSRCWAPDPPPELHPPSPPLLSSAAARPACASAWRPGLHGLAALQPSEFAGRRLPALRTRCRPYVSACTGRGLGRRHGGSELPAGAAATNAATRHRPRVGRPHGQAACHVQFNRLMHFHALPQTPRTRCCPLTALPPTATLPHHSAPTALPTTRSAVSWSDPTPGLTAGLHHEVRPHHQGLALCRVERQVSPVLRPQEVHQAPPRRQQRPVD